jgi:hypothetical protein
MIDITTLLRRLGVIAAVIALAGAALAPGHARAAVSVSYSPYGAVTNASNGTIWYFLDSTPMEQPHVEGWAVDPDAGAGPITVSETVSWYRTTCWTFCFSRLVGQTSASQTADQAESATAGTFYGANHGFSFWLPWFVGQYDREQVCVTAINAGLLGSNTSLGCYDVQGYHVT